MWQLTKQQTLGHPPYAPAAVALGSSEILEIDTAWDVLADGNPEVGNMIVNVGQGFGLGISQTPLYGVSPQGYLQWGGYTAGKGTNWLLTH